MKKGLLLLIGVLVITSFISCGKKDKEVILIGHKNFTEQRFLGEMMGILIEKNTDNKVSVKELGGTMLVNEGLENGQIDLSAEYTGTGYLYLLKESGIKDPSKMYDYVKEEFAKKGIMWLKPLGFNNTYAFAVKPKLAKKFNLKTISDLAKVAKNLKAGEAADFFSREDGMPGITKTYGFSFGEEVEIDPGLKYLAVEKGNIDVAVAYATDGMLKKYNMVVLEDDKNFFPPYDAVPRMQTEFAKSHPEVVKELNKLGGVFSNEDLQKYNYQIDALEYPIKKVAESALKEKGLIK